MTPGVFYFGDSRIGIAARELVRGGERVDLAPVVFDCIAYLIQHRDRAVGRDELVAAVWGKASVSDAVMGKTILIARRAVGDTAEAQRCIRTVPRFGYQWVAPTSAEPNASPSLLDGTTEPSTRRPQRLWAIAAIVALTIGIIGAAAIFRFRSAVVDHGATTAQSNESPVESVVVLPVEVAGPRDDGWLRLGLMDLLAARLRTSGLAVMPSDNVVRLVPENTPRENAIAAVRGVAERSHVIVALARRAGSAWVLRADLVEPDGNTRSVQREADSAIVAAGALTDGLLELLGRRASAESIDTARLTETELLQRIDAARLANDPDHARALIDAASPALRDAPEVQLRLAQIDLRTGRFDAAEKRLTALAVAVPEEQDAFLHARVQSYLCIALARVGRMDAGVEACDRAISILETRGQPDELGRAYSDRGIIRTLQQRYDLSSQDFARARIALNLAGDALLLAKVDGNESVLDMAQGRYGEAVAMQQRVGERFERFGMINELAASLDNQTLAHLALLQPLDALKTSDRALALGERVTDASIRFLTKLQRADALAVNGRLGEAHVLLDEVIHDADTDQYAPERAVARTNEARLAIEAGRPADAMLLADEAIPALPAPPYATVRASAWLTLIRSLRALGRTADAADRVRAFKTWADSVSDEDTTLYARIAEAEQAAAERRTDAARSLFEEAMTLAARRNVPNTLSETVQSYGRYLLAQGDLPKASTVIGLVARYAEVDFDSALLQAELYGALGQKDAMQAALAEARRLAGERVVPATVAAL